jgi:hypothetical protein
MGLLLSPSTVVSAPEASTMGPRCEERSVAFYWIIVVAWHTGRQLPRLVRGIVKFLPAAEVTAGHYPWEVQPH